MPQPIEILYEDDGCLVINKPAGLAVQGGVGISISLDSLLARTYSPRPLLVHRLDRDTSGVMLVLKNKTAAAHYSRLIGEGAASKQYLAVCAGTPEPGAGVIRMDIEVRGKRKSAETRYTVLYTARLPLPVGGPSPLPESRSGIFSVLELELASGRMHQIRRHMALAGTPILGDDKYGDFSLNKALAKTMKLKRLLLHAFRLRIPPGCGVPPLDVHAPRPAHFTAFLEHSGCGTGQHHSFQI
jgi:23S rRNA pseudouridine955/2504/2580 synthase